jgi:hypothetical protein
MRQKDGRGGEWRSALWNGCCYHATYRLSSSVVELMLTRRCGNSALGIRGVRELSLRAVALVSCGLGVCGRICEAGPCDL